MTEPPTNRVTWVPYYRLIASAYPPIDVFEDIADPADWMLLASAEGKTNPRIAETIGRLDLIPPERRVGGKGASYVMAPFTHCTTDRPGRFHDGTFGAFYGANSFETAIAETVFHLGRFFRATEEAPGWLSVLRELRGDIDRDLADIRGGGFDDCLRADDYGPSQNLARQLKASGRDGIVYCSVRQPDGECFAAFWPDVMGIPVQARHFRCHWNGDRLDMIKDMKEGGPAYFLEE